MIPNGLAQTSADQQINASKGVLCVLNTEEKPHKKKQQSIFCVRPEHRELAKKQIALLAEIGDHQSK